MDNSGKNNKTLGSIFHKEYNFPELNPFGGNYNPFNAKTSAKPLKRINGYDSAILNKTNIEEAETDDLSLDYRIKEKESIIKDLDSKIKTADNYGTQNEALGLKAKRQRILQELNSLRKQQIYGSGVFEDKHGFHKTFKEKMPVIFKIQDFISRHILARISGKIKSVVTLSDSLEQLSDISRSVDELIDMNVPYGEKVQNYEKLTNYLNKANKIHSKISKSLRKTV